MQTGRHGWLDGALCSQHIARPPDEVWDQLLTIDQTPAWRTHLGPNDGAH